MDTIMITGTRCFPHSGSIARPGPFWSERTGMPLVGGGCSTVAIAARPVYRTRLQALITLNTPDFPVTDRMRASASEP
jgi:hypothetical protein